MCRDAPMLQTHTASVYVRAEQREFSAPPDTTQGHFEQQQSHMVTVRVVKSFAQCRHYCGWFMCNVHQKRNYSGWIGQMCKCLRMDMIITWLSKWLPVSCEYCCGLVLFVLLLFIVLMLLYITLFNFLLPLWWIKMNTKCFQCALCALIIIINNN